MGSVVIETKNMTKKFGSFTAVDNVSMQIEEGTIYGFLGPNGSGKTTTMKVLCGLLAATSGEGLVLGMNLAHSSQEIKNKVGYMSQKFSLYPDLTARENLEFYAGLYGMTDGQKAERIPAMLKLAGLEGRENTLTSELTGGWRQRLALGCAIVHKPKILFLDEPTSGVDPKARRLFWDIIYNLSQDGTTIMVTTHFMDESEHCDKVAFIYFGKLIADDTPENLKKVIPGRLYEIKCKNGMDLLADIQDGALGISLIDSYFHGEKLHVIVEGDARLNAGGILADTEISEMVPSMEDVFAYLVKAESGKAMEGGRISGAGQSKIKKRSKEA